MREELIDSIYHHGIKGMHWGIRRTPEQLGHPRKEKRPRYDVSPRKLKKNQKYMTDQELRRSIDRVNMQRQINQMNPSAYRRGINFVNQYKNDLKTITSAVAVTTAAYKLGQKFFKALPDSFYDSFRPENWFD